MSELSAADVEVIASLVKKHCGVVLQKDQGYLMETKILPVLQKHKLPNLKGLVDKIKSGISSELLEDIVYAVINHDSSFYRDSKPFDQIKKVLVPKLVSGGKAKITVWSAGCANGQEAVSAALSIIEAPEAKSIALEVLGTDIFKIALNRAKTFAYSQSEMQRGMPVPVLLKHFKQNGENWELSPDIRPKISYKEQNLIQDFSTLGKYDIILCRNVLNGFDLEGKVRVLNEMIKHMEKTSYLILGIDEAITGIENKLALVPGMSSIYALV